MLTAKQVSKMLGVAVRTVYGIPPDQLPRYKIGGAVRYDPQDIGEYLRSCRSSSPEPPKETV